LLTDQPFLTLLIVSLIKQPLSLFPITVFSMFEFLSGFIRIRSRLCLPEVSKLLPQLQLFPLLPWPLLLHAQELILQQLHLP